VSLPVDVETETAISADGLCHAYSPGRGLEPVSFAIVGPGSVAVTGRNGSGKSTLLKILAGLLRASGGALEMIVAGLAVPPVSRRLHVGFASPELTFYDELTVGENLVFAAEATGISDPWGRMREAIERVGLGPRASDRVAALSSGMKQRLRIAFALLGRPPVLLLDEPSSHLDDDGRARVERVLEEQRRSGLVMIATNDEREWRLAEQRIELRGRGVGHPA
jgi:heme exporter protein A